MINNIKPGIKKLILIIFIFDALVILGHLFFGHKYDFFNMDLEKNLPTYYSGVQLFFSSLLALLMVAFAKNSKRKLDNLDSLAILGIFTLFFYLGLDEIAIIHERITGALSFDQLYDLEIFTNKVFYWTILYIPLITLGIYALVKFLIKILKTELVARKFFFAGIILFLIPLGLEFLGGFLSAREGLYFILTTIEETCEIMGASFFIFSLIIYFAANYLRDEKKEYGK